MASRITDFIVDGNDYFSANLDDGGVRFGIVGGLTFSIPPSHPKFVSVSACLNEEDLEAIFDEMVGSLSSLGKMGW